MPVACAHGVRDTHPATQRHADVYADHHRQRDADNHPIWFAWRAHRHVDGATIANADPSQYCNSNADC